MSKMEDTLTQLMQMSIINQKKINASIKYLEVQVEKLAKQLSEHGSGSFSVNTQVNPEEQCNAITTRCGNVVSLTDNGEKKNKGVVEQMIKNKELKDSRKQIDFQKKKTIRFQKEHNNNKQ